MSKCITRTIAIIIYTYGLSLEQAGFLILANTALSSLLQPFLGYISDKINQPRLIAMGVLLSACSTGMMGFVTSYESLLICATLAGVGSSIFHPEGAKIMNRLGGGKKGKAMGTFAIGGSSGFAIGPLFAGAIAYTVGPHGLAAFTVVGILISSVLFVLMPRIVAHARTIDQAVATEDPTIAAKPLKNYGNTLVYCLSSSSANRSTSELSTLSSLFSGLVNSVLVPNKAVLH